MNNDKRKFEFTPSVNVGIIAIAFWLLIMLLMLFSCTKEPLHECGTVMGKQIKGMGAAGSQKIYLYVQHDSIINQVPVGLLQYEHYQVGDTYCDPNFW